MTIKIQHNEIPGTVLEAKRWWRKQIREAQKGLTDEYMTEASEAIREQLMRMEEYRKAKTVMLYVNCGKEVVTRSLMDVANRAGKTVCLPLCYDTDQHLMDARLWNAEHKLVAGAYGIPEPASDAPVIDPKEIDLVVLPCMSCDANCNRLGHGAGYYDRYLTQLRDDVVTVALCYEEILAENIPTEEHDKKVNAVITEERVYKWDGALSQGE